ncbi:hypothetical protein HDU93_005653, partial [Gonapodya sp. JEL0774]
MTTNRPVQPANFGTASQLPRPASPPPQPSPLPGPDPPTTDLSDSEGKEEIEADTLVGNPATAEKVKVLRKRLGNRDSQNLGKNLWRLQVLCCYLEMITPGSCDRVEFLSKTAAQERIVDCFFCGHNSGVRRLRIWARLWLLTGRLPPMRASQLASTKSLLDDENIRTAADAWLRKADRVNAKQFK